MISYPEALKLTLENIIPLPAEDIELSNLVGRIVAEDIVSKVDSPSVDMSLKDGYAVQSADIAPATPDQPVYLRQIGSLAAGGDWEGSIEPGTTVRILSGARIPEGAQAVVAEEFTRVEGNNVIVMNCAEPGRNILPRGTDVAQGEHLLSSGHSLRPSHVGLLAAGGYVKASVVRNPSVAILATGDEVIAPGRPLPEGKLFASNLVNLAAWCASYGMEFASQVVPDDPVKIQAAIEADLHAYDALVTSGGAWKGERDLVVKILEEIGWQKIYHRIRLGPGKAVGFGMWKGKPIFCLPGGPPSNLVAFLQLALPGLLRLGGQSHPRLPSRRVRLASAVIRTRPWTQCKFGQILHRDDSLYFEPEQEVSRLQAMAKADALLTLPEGIDEMQAGEVVDVQVLDTLSF